MENVNDLLAAFLNAEEDHGFSSDLIPKGTYPVEIAEVQRVLEGRAKKDEETGIVHPGGVMVGMRLEILDGPLAGRSAFVSLNLVNLFDAARRGSKFWNMSATFIRVIGAKILPVNPDACESVEKACSAAYAPAEWKGLRFMAQIGVETLDAQKRKAEKRGAEVNVNAQDRNTLTGWHGIEDVDNGLAAWREKELPKQVAKSKNGAATEAAAPRPAKSAVKF